MHPCPHCQAELKLARGGERAMCPNCRRRWTWVLGRGWLSREDAQAATAVNWTRGAELAFVIKGYLVDPQTLSDHEPTWDELLAEIRRILRNPLFDFGDLEIVKEAEGQALIVDGVGQELARTTLERPGRVRTTPVDGGS